MNRFMLLIGFLILFSSCLKKPDYHIDISYTGEQLQYIQCPIGANDSASILLNGYGGISSLEMNRKAAKDEIPPSIAYFSLYTKASEGDSVVRILEREYLNEYPVQTGLLPRHLEGLPRFKDAIFHNAYPFIRIDLSDEAVPLDVTMEAWSPLIPLDLVNSTLPCVILEWKLTNSTKIPTEYSIALTMGDHLFIEESDSLEPPAGQFSVSMPLEGKLAAINGETGPMYSIGSLEAGESVSIPFLFAWLKPSGQLAYPQASFFSDIDELREYITGNFNLLRTKTLQFSEAMITSSVPPGILDAAISNLSSFKNRETLFPLNDFCFKSNTQDQNLTNIMGIYQEWKKSGSKEWLGELWPDIMYVLENEWDREESESLHLAVLKAVSEMALVMNEPQKSLEFYENYKKEVKKFQLGEGNMSDQLRGQYLAFNTGMGYLMDKSMLHNALRSMYENNFAEEMSEVDRVKGDFKTEIDYQLAAMFIYAGMSKEGLSLARVARQRYSGAKMNPFAEIESEDYLKRKGASWGLYKAMAGYQYDGTKGYMKFAPAEDFLPIRYFWSTASAWGKVEVSRAKIELICLHGELDIEELEFAGKSFFVFREFDVSEPCEVLYEEEALKILFPKHLHLVEGESFLMSLP